MSTEDTTPTHPHKNHPRTLGDPAGRHGVVCGGSGVGHHRLQLNMQTHTHKGRERAISLVFDRHPHGFGRDTCRHIQTYTHTRTHQAIRRDDMEFYAGVREWATIICHADDQAYQQQFEETRRCEPISAFFSPRFSLPSARELFLSLCSAFVSLRETRRCELLSLAFPSPLSSHLGV